MKDTELLKKIGESLKQHRTEKGISQKTLAKDCNISEHSISRIENGETHVRIGTLLKISRTLGIGLDNLTQQ